jgi:hydrogenase-4 component E
MSGELLDLLLVVVLLLNFFVLVAGYLPAAIYQVGIQGAIIGAMPLLIHQGFDIRVLLLSVSTIIVKAIIFPRMLFYAIREVGFQRETTPIMGFIPCLLLGAAGTGLAMEFSQDLGFKSAELGGPPEHLVPTALSTVLIGYLMLATRRRAITQTLGYLVLENGVFLFGLLLVEAMPLLVELGVLLDLFVGVFVMGITIQHLTRGFASDSTEHLSALRE